MKKLLFGMMAFVAFVATSCQQAPEELNVVAGGDANVTFSVGAPQIANRAYSDGLTATRLQYAVYAVSEANSTKSLRLLSDLKGTETLDELKTSINLQLTTGNKYAVVFWADQPDNTHYKVTFDPATVTVDVLDYASAKSNDETRDAFYAVHEFTVSGTQTETVYLKRPFAQLNIGANDFLASEKAGHKVTHAKVTVPAYSTLDLVSGVADNQTSVTFDYAAVPTGETFPVANYEYLAMNYLLMNTAEEVVDLTFYYATGVDASNNGLNEKSRVVGSVPFQRNHRTNIYGQLFTGDVTVNVEIKPGFDDPAHNVDGAATDTVTVPANNTEDVVLGTETIEVAVPAASAQEGDTYKIVVSNESTETNTTTGETTASFDLVLYKNDVKVSGDTTVYNVDWNIGAGKILSGVTHNGTPLTNATTGEDQTYTYDATTGVLTIYTKSFSPFAVNYIDLKETFADNTWNNIALACQNNVVPASWKVGDKKTMTIGGAAYNVAIIGKNHDVYSDGTGLAPLTFQLVEIYGTAAMNATQTNATGWSGSKMRNTTMVEALAAMPIEVQNAVKAVDKLTLKGDASGLETTSDKLFLLSLFECYGSTFYSNGYEEGSIYEYYSSIDKRIMNATWWLRGPGVNNGKNNGIGFTQINMSGYMANGSAETSIGVIFGFCF